MTNIIESSLTSLKKKKIPNPELDLRILIKHASKIKKEVTLNNVNLDNVDLDYFKSLVLKRLNNEPISKIINKKYFWKNEFYVNSYVLDPRPETELIIDEVLENVQSKEKKIKILDIGTGSGCIAISLAHELPNAEITAIDVCPKALDVANKNIKFNKFDKRINLQLINFYNLKEKYDFIVSNPPYLSEGTYKTSQKEIKNYEPKIALLGGKDGLFFYKLFAKNIEKILKNNSFFICEIGHDQLNSCINIFKNTNLNLKKISKDIQNFDRTLTFSNI